MNFLVLAIVLLINRFFSISALRYKFNVSNLYLIKIDKTFSAKSYFKNWSGLGVILAPAMIITLLLILIFADIAHGFFLPIFNLIVLFYCLDGCDYQNQSELSPQAQKAMYHFTTVFWFVFLGAFGVILAKLLQDTINSKLENDMPKTACRCYFYYAWIPSRLLAATFALVSHFNKVLDYCMLNFKSVKNLEFLESAANIALDENYEPEKATKLFDKALLIWMAVLAIFVLA